MAPEKIALCDFSTSIIVRDYGITIPDVIQAKHHLEDSDEIWLQVGLSTRRGIELASGFKDLQEKSLERYPYVEKKEGRLHRTRRSALWVRMEDIGDAKFYSPDEK